MIKARLTSLYTAFVFAVVLASACSSQKEPAQAALDNATNAVNAALTPDADKYTPQDVSGLQSKLANLKSTFDTKNYAGVITAAPDVTAAAIELTQSVAAKKDAETKKDAEAKKWTAEWTDASASLPELLASVHSRIDELSKARHPPKIVNLATARSDLADAESLWKKAEGSYGAGKAAEAVAATKEVKAKAEAGAAAINMTLPEAPAK